jgi:hypothetical protein
MVNRVGRHLTDWAGGGLVLLGLLLAAMAVASLPAILQMPVGRSAAPLSAPAAPGQSSRVLSWT